MKAKFSAIARAVVLHTWVVNLTYSGSPSTAAADHQGWPILNSTVDADAGFGAFPARLQASEKRQEGTSTIELSLDINMSLLPQRLTTQLVLPQDNCRNFSAENVVAQSERAVLSVEDGKLRVVFKGRYSLWDCRENPVPNSRVEWEVKNLGLGVKTKVPVVKTWPGLPIKNKLFEQAYTATSLIELQPGSAGTMDARVSSNLQPESMALQKARNTLQEAVQRPPANVVALLQKIGTAETLLKLLPTEYRELKLALKSAAFSTWDGDPIVSLVFETRLTTAEADALKQRLLADPLRAR